METEDQFKRINELTDQLVEQVGKSTAALHNKIQECESYKRLSESYEKSQEELLKKIERLEALNKVAEEQLEKLINHAA